jgi:hypothetical protein
MSLSTSSLAVGLGDLRLDRDDALETGLEVAHPSRNLPDWTPPKLR